MNRILAKKSLGQHFLVNKSLINDITSDWAQNAHAILEVGPGKGALTTSLTQWNLPFHVLEKDQRMYDVLINIIRPEQITIADALETDLDKLIEQLKWQNKDIWLVSNLPYNVSVLLMLKFIRTSSICYMTLMFQKEVGEKFLPNQEKKNPMNSLMAICSNYFEIKMLAKVRPGSFNPPPEVDSIVLSFKRHPNPLVPLNEFSSYETFLRQLFAFKRKQMGTILSKIYEPNLLQHSFATCQIKSTARAESLPLSTIISLYHLLKHNANIVRTSSS